MAQQIPQKGEEPRHTKVFREWKGVYTRSSRNAIPEDNWYNLENVIPIGNANAHVVPNISSVLHDFAADIIYWSQYINILGVDYEICFSSNGKVFSYNIGTTVTTQIATGFSGSGSRVAQWKNTQALFIDATGYYHWDGTTFSIISGAGVPSSGTDIAVCFGRVWIVQGRLLTFSGADDFTATSFLVANGAGSIALTDPTLRSIVTRLYAQNGYLYFTGSTSINAISDLYVPQGAVPPTPLFTNTNLQATIGSDQPGSFFPMNRSVMFANGYGAWALNGVQAERISEDIDGTWQWINSGLPVSGGAAVVANILNSGFLVQRLNDPLYGSNTIVAMNFDKKWWFANYGALTFIMGGIVANKPALFGFIANKLYQLFADTTTGPPTVLSTALWPMEDNLADKEIIRAGFEATVRVFSGSFAMTADTVNSTQAAVTLQTGGFVSWQNNALAIVLWQNNALATVSWFSGQVLLYNGTAPGTYGKYVGFTVTSSGSIYEFNGTDMDYKLRARWS